MNILIINGSPKHGGFTGGALDFAATCLQGKGVTINHVRLADMTIHDCRGCFNCLKTGKCVIPDDVETIIKEMIKADGFVIGSPVRNALITACFKKFIERITYILGFTLALEDKYTLGIASVGYIGGKSISRKFCCLQDVFHTHLSDFVFCSVGIPSEKNMAKVESRLAIATDKLIADISRRPQRSFYQRTSYLIDRVVIRKFMIERHPDVYANVIESWKSKGYIRPR